MGVRRTLRDAGRAIGSDLLTRARVHRRWSAPKHHDHCSSAEHPEVLFYEAIQLLVVADESEKQGLERNNRTFEYAFSRFRKTAGGVPGVWAEDFR